MERLTNTEKKILDALTENASKTLSELAVELNLSRQTIAHNISTLRKKKIIRRFTVDLDHQKLGLELPVLILVKTKHVEIQTFKKMMETPSIKDEKNVNDVFTMSGDYAFGIFGWWKNKEEYGKWKTELIMELKKIDAHDSFELNEFVIWDFYRYRGLFKIPEHIKEYVQE